MTKSKTKPVRRMWAAYNYKVADKTWYRIVSNKKTSIYINPVYVVDARPEAMEALHGQAVTAMLQWGTPFHRESTNELAREVLAAIFKGSKGAK